MYTTKTSVKCYGFIDTMDRLLETVH